MPIVKVNSKNRMQFPSSREGAPLAVIAVVFALLSSATTTLAQTLPPARPAPTPPPEIQGTKKSDDDRPLTTLEEELRAKRLIKMAEKDHQENLSRAREIVQIAKELKELLKDKTTIDRGALKKTERLEKLTKKVRGESGGQAEEVEIVNRPTDLSSALTQICEAAETLSKDVHNTPRQVVSASVIGNANVLLELVKIARSFAR